MSHGKIEFVGFLDVAGRDESPLLEEPLLRDQTTGQYLIQRENGTRVEVDTE